MTFKKLAVADLGSNTFRLVAADLSTNGELRETRLLQRVVRLGQGLGLDGRLAPEALERAASCLDEFGRALKTVPVDSVTAAVTAAGRDLKGSGLVLDMAREKLGARVFVPTGLQEAAYSFKGAVSLIGGENGEAVLLDIGGGSTEIARGEGGVPGTSQSLKLGVVRLTEEARPPDPVRGEDYGMMKTRASLIFREADFFKRDLPDFAGGARLLVNAGTPLTIAAMKTGLGPENTRALTGTPIGRADVEATLSKLLYRTQDEILSVPGIVRGREDVILAGVAILDAFLELAGDPVALVTDGGMAEGLILAEAGKLLSCPVHYAGRAVPRHARAKVP